jgi:hypothetical protein
VIPFAISYSLLNACLRKRRTQSKGSDRAQERREEQKRWRAQDPEDAGKDYARFAESIKTRCNA